MRGSIKHLLLWLSGCGFITATVWAITLVKIEDDKTQAEKSAFILATSISSSYAEQLAFTINHIDQISRKLKYDWENLKDSVNLESEAQKGVYSLNSEVNITITDRDGNSLTSTLGGPPVSVADRAYFQYHQSSKDDRLRYDDNLSPGRRSGKKVIRFTRRLNAPDGSFNGVLVIGAEPSYFATFNVEESLNPRDLMSVRNVRGALLVSEKGRDIRGQEVHIAPPVFDQGKGARWASADFFKDHEARIIAWHKNKNYPLVSYVGLSASGIFASQKENELTYTRISLAATAFLMLASLIGAYFSWHLKLRKQQNEEIKKAFTFAVDRAQEGFFILRPLYNTMGDILDFVIEDCNETGAQLIGVRKQLLIGAKITTLYKQRAPKFLALCKQAMEAGVYEDEYKAAPRDKNSSTWIHRRMVHTGVGIAVTLRDVSESKLHELALLSMANTDTLTGLPNRQWLIKFLPSALKKASAENKMLAILYIDLDGFKNVNDSLGHKAGDILLQEAAVRLKSVLRPHDYVVRLAGDEFTVLLTRVGSREEIPHVASRIVHTFREPFSIFTTQKLVGTSIGISLFPQDGDNNDVLLQRADMAMYAAKNEGKGRFQFYDQRLSDGLKIRLDKEQKLANAITQDQFIIFYQPRVNTFTGELAGMEALVRWIHPEEGLVFPNDFIPLAESTGLILPLSDLIMNKVCSQIAGWEAQKLPVVPVSVNISAQQFNAGEVDKFIDALITRYEIPYSLLEVELTESALMSESPHVIDQVTALNRLGVKIHLDDFGTGYSSLSRLQKFKMHVLKIDRAFTSRIGTSKQADVLFTTIVNMARALNMRVVAEGVEFDYQLALLQKLSCDEIQGYLISAPVESNDVPALMRKKSLFSMQAVLQGARPISQPDTAPATPES